MFRIIDLIAGYFGNTVLHEVTLEIGATERIGIFGHNGSGKSTLLRCLIGDVPQMRGTVSFAGQPITQGAVARNVAYGIGFVPQSDNVFAGLTVEHCLRIAGLASARPPAEIYDIFPVLRGRRRQLAGSLSGGERQMLAVGMALMTRPKVLLLDEPTAGLAPVRARRARQPRRGEPHARHRTDLDRTERITGARHRRSRRRAARRADRA